MKMDGTENDWGCEITKTGLIWERGIWLHYPRLSWNQKLFKYTAPKFDSGAVKDSKHIRSFVELLRKQYIEVLVDFGLGVAVLTAEGPH